MSKEANKVIKAAYVLANKSARVALDASYSVEYLVGLAEPLVVENKKLKKRCSELENEIDRWKDLMAKEVARLKAENERLRKGSFVTAVPSKDYEKLKAEVENSNRINRELLVLCNQQASRVRNLIEAGDAMALGIKGDYNYPMPCVQAWNAAKEGKPSV